MSVSRIFVSYSHQDSAWCSHLVDALTQSGFDVWFDLQSPHHDDAWIPTIETELGSGDVLLVILTPWSWISPRVQRDVQLALRRGQRLLGVRHERVVVIDFIAPDQILEAVGRDPGHVARQIGAILRAALTDEGSPLEPRVDGLYVATMSDDYKQYLRFYTDGRVECSSIVSTEEPQNVVAAGWSTRDRSQGDYTLNANQLAFTLRKTTRGAIRRVMSLTGTVMPQRDALELDVESSLSSAAPSDHRTYRFALASFGAHR